MKRSYYRILRLLREKSLNYNELLEQMWGIYPEDLNKAIKQLKEEDLIIEEASGIYQAKEVSTNDYCEIDKDYIIDGEQIEKVLSETSRIMSKIPAPHPQSYDWRFTNDAIKSFYFEIVKYRSKQDKLCIIAAPSLFIFLRLF